MFRLRVFAVSGYSGSGKTRLVVRLVQLLRDRGYKVATVKSTSKDIVPPEGTDTLAHLTAGANPVILLGPKNTTICFDSRVDLKRILRDDDADFLLIEGAKQSSVPKVWCIGDHKLIINEVPPETKSVIVWNESEEDLTALEIPVLLAEDFSAIIGIIEKEAIAFEYLDL